MQIFTSERTKRVLLAFLVALLICAATAILISGLSGSDKVALLMATVGYLFWPFYRLTLGAHKGLSNTLLLIVFYLCLSTGSCSYLSMLILLARSNPPTDAGDLIMGVWGGGILSFYASLLILFGTMIADARRNNDVGKAITTILASCLVIYGLLKIGAIESISITAAIILALGVIVFIFTNTVHRFRIRRKSEQTSLRCAYCKDSLEFDSDLFCPSCRSPHHPDCYTTHGCATFACSSSKTGDAGARVK